MSYIRQLANLIDRPPLSLTTNLHNSRPKAPVRERSRSLSPLIMPPGLEVTAVIVPDHMVGAVIGKFGCNIKSMERAAGCRIKQRRNNEFIIRGDPVLEKAQIVKILMEDQIDQKCRVVSFKPTFDQYRATSGQTSLKHFGRPSPVRRSPVRRSPVRRSPVRRSPVRRSPVRRSPVRRSPVRLSPSRRSPSRRSSSRERRRSSSGERRRSRSASRRSSSRERKRSHSRERRRSRSRSRRSSSRSSRERRRSRSRDRSRDHSRDRKRTRSRSRGRESSRDSREKVLNPLTGQFRKDARKDIAMKIRLAEMKMKHQSLWKSYY